MRKNRGANQRSDAPVVPGADKFRLPSQKELKNGAAVLLIADECHRYTSEQNRLIFEFLPYIKPYEDRFFSLGPSATLPSGADGQYLSSVLGRQIYNYDMKQAGADEKALAEAVRCLRLGTVRADWLPGRRNLTARIKEATHISDKNYWICMKKICESQITPPPAE